MSKYFLTTLSAGLTAALLAGCAVEVVSPRQPRAYVAVPVAYVPAPPPPVVSVYIDPPFSQPPPIAVSWAPPPMLVDAPPPQPFDDSVWIGGYWSWHGDWVWAAGRWVAPPRRDFIWFQPYYEHRGPSVVYVSGFWSAPSVAFVPPPVGLIISVAIVAPGVVIGAAPIGPQGIFIPAPPGSRLGIIVPAPLGTAPAVTMSLPPVANVGMRVQTTINNNISTINHVTNTTNITNVTNVTVVAPAAAMVSGKAFQAAVPAKAQLAAALPPVSQVHAPSPTSTTPIPGFNNNGAKVALPPPQAIRSTPRALVAKSASLPIAPMVSATSPVPNTNTTSVNAAPAAVPATNEAAAEKAKLAAEQARAKQLKEQAAQSAAQKQVALVKAQRDKRAAAVKAQRDKQVAVAKAQRDKQSAAEKAPRNGRAETDADRAARLKREKEAR